MTLIAATVTITLLGLWAVQVILAAGFIARLRRSPATPLSDDQWPKVALIICIRGKDPTLFECLDAVFDQDYPDYCVHIIVDSRSDPAWPAVTKIVAANPITRSTVDVLLNPLRSCSLKCSSLIQAVSSIDLDCKVVALLDTDVVPDRNWLKSMVAPLADRTVGATTGNRWFVPNPPSLAGFIRYVWNAAAVVLMHRLQIAWGGSLAIRRSVVDEGQLKADWSHTYGEDTAINPALRRLGLRLEFVSSALARDGENCSLSLFLDWATRQLLSCRLHHHGWKYVVAYGIVTSMGLAATVLVLVAGLATENQEVVLLTATGLALYFLMIFALLVGVEFFIRGTVAARNPAEIWPVSPLTVVKLGLAVPLAQLLYAFTLFRAATMRSVEWRRARYEILDQNRIRLVDDDRYRGGSSSQFTQSLGISLRRRL